MGPGYLQDKMKARQVNRVFDVPSRFSERIPKPHDLGFCFLATASTLKEFYGLTFAPQTIPASPAVLKCRFSTERLLLVDSRGGRPIALSSFPGLPICLRRQSCWTSLVRLSESIVSGGSVTNSIVSCQAVLKHGVSNPFF